MAQNTISGTLQGEHNAIVKLYAYTGLELTLLDSTMTGNHGDFGFEEFLTRGMYVVETDNKSFELIYDNSPIQMIAYTDGNVQFVGSEINQKWTAYIKKRQEYRHNIEVLKQVIRQYDSQTAFYANACAEFVAEQNRFSMFCDSIETIETDYVSRLVRTDRPMSIDPNTTISQQRQKVASLFLADVDFNDTTLIPTNILTTKLIDYVSTVQADMSVSSDLDIRMIIALSKIFDYAKVNQTMYAFVLEYMLKGYSALGMEKVTNYLLGFPCIGEGEITEEQGRRLEAVTEPYQKVRVGAKAPAIDGIAIDGRKYTSNKSDKDVTILLFWSVDCPYCHEIIAKINKKMDLHNIDFLTFAIADSLGQVTDALSQMRVKEGLHFYSEARWESEWFKEYHVFSTPTMFVLNSERVIVAKPNSWRELHECVRKMR